jgi:hypothetical protein
MSSITKKICFTLFAFSSLLTACTQPEATSTPTAATIDTPATTVTPPPVINTDTTITLSCSDALRQLIKSSEVFPNLDSLNIKHDGMENDTLLIKVSHSNEVEPGAFVDAADGFMRIDMKGEKLLRVMIAEERDDEVACDKKLLHYYITHCIGEEE